jgi:hypothetical protein
MKPRQGTAPLQSFLCSTKEEFLPNTLLGRQLCTGQQPYLLCQKAINPVFLDLEKQISMKDNLNSKGKV